MSSRPWQRSSAGLLTCVVALAQAPAYSSVSSGNVGAAVCGQCHRAIANTQAKTNMARTWNGRDLLPSKYKEDHSEGPAPAVVYNATRTQFETTLPGRAPVKGTVEAIIGGERHGVSFLMRLRSIEGEQLARGALVEARYLHGTHENALVLSP